MPKLTAVIPPSINRNSFHPIKESVAQTCSRGDTSAPLHIPYNVTISAEGGQVFQKGQLIIATIGAPYLSAKGLSANSSANRHINQYTLDQVIHAYRKSESTLLSQLKGHFALVIIDLANNRCLAASDRIGVYRLYWHKSAEGNLVLSTSLREIKSICNLSNDISHQALYSYMYFHMVPTPLSIHPEIHKLPPGQALSFTPKSLKIEPFWQPEFKSDSSNNIDELAVQLLQQIEDSTQRALAPGGSNGAFLSGGLDSSTVAGMFSKIAPQQASTYSIGFNAKAYDETPFARLTANHYQTRHNEYFVTPEDVLDSLPTIVQSMDEPFGNSSVIPTYYCAKLAAEQGITNLLAGDGGDELFAGNTRYATQKIYNYYLTAPKTLREKLLSPAIFALPDSFPYAGKAKRYIAQADITLPKRLQIYNFLNRHPGDEIFSADFLASIDPSIPDGLQQQVYDRPKDASELNRMLFLDWQFTLADNDLRKVSQMCELAGVNVSYPLLSDELIDFSCQIPDKLKLKGQKLRYFYKYAMRDFLPPQTLTKSKHGFGLPFGVWLREYQPLREMAYETLQKLKSRHYFQKDFIDKAFKMHDEQHASYYGELIWLMMVLELWLDS